MFNGETIKKAQKLIEKDEIKTTNGCAVRKDFINEFDPFEISIDERIGKINKIKMQQQEFDFINEHKADYVFEEERPDKDNNELFIKNVTKKYQSLLNKISRKEKIKKSDKQYVEFRDKLQEHLLNYYRNNE